ncbi:hypothetical protein MN608_00221 [Microdochium nivale]|nr:hypothetical protein MN608_00221 [Microdochium nivale]
MTLPRWQSSGSTCDESSRETMPYGSLPSAPRTNNIDNDGGSYNIAELFLQHSVTTLNTPMRSSRAGPVEIYDALLLVTRKHPSQTRLCTAHEEGRNIRQIRHDSTEACFVYKGLKKHKSPFPPALRAPALPLFLTCRHVYREFAPIFYGHSSIVISEDLVLAPEVLETVVLSSPIITVARNRPADEPHGG